MDPCSNHLQTYKDVSAIDSMFSHTSSQSTRGTESPQCKFQLGQGRGEEKGAKELARRHTDPARQPLAEVDPVNSETDVT